MASQEVLSEARACFLNQTELAAELNTSRMSLNRWSKEPDFPRAEGGKYDVAAVKSWISSRGKLQGSGRHVETENTAELRKMLLAQEIRLNELDIAERERELVRFADAREICLRAISPLGRRVKDLPASMCLKANPTAPTVAKAALREWADETLNLIQEQCRKISAES